MKISELSPRSDARGSSFGVTLPFASVEECHVATLRPGQVRGNHFHASRRELLVVLHADRWTLFWDSGEGTPVESRTFEGSGAVQIEIEPGYAHAVRNDGRAEVQLMSMGDRAGVDTFVRKLIEPRVRLAGLDGCRDGWIAVIKDGAQIETRICRSDEELLALFRECSVVAIDIPIGLAERGARLCDVEARKKLGPKRGSSVFPAPIRAVLGLSYPEANQRSRDVQDRGMSKQAHAILPKIEQVDCLLREHPGLPVHEVHPEVTFLEWNGGPVPSKQTAEGIEARRALVLAHFGEIPPVPRGAKEDDLLDAFAALWTAERIESRRERRLGEAPMQIVY